MVLLAMIPVATATPLGTITKQSQLVGVQVEQSIPENKLDAIMNVYYDYESELLELDSILLDYIDEYGSLDTFEFSPEQQALIDEITVALENEIDGQSVSVEQHVLGGIIMPLGGGVNAFYIYPWLLPPGLQYQIWIDHTWTPIFAHICGFSITLAAVVLAYFIVGGTLGLGLTLAIGIVIWVVSTFGAEGVNSFDNGNGIIINAVDFWIPMPMTIDYGWIESQ